MERHCLSIVLVSLISVTIYMAIQANELHKEFQEWEQANPVAAAVDFSQPGRMVFEFYQTCPSAHGQVLFLEVEPELSDSLGVASDFDGTYELRDKAGTSVESGRLLFDVAIDPAHVQLALLRVAPVGDYRLEIEIESGDSRLARRQQTLKSEYRLCGLESMPAMLYTFGALICGFFATLAGVIASWKMVAARLRRNSLPTEDERADAKTDIAAD